MWAGQTIPEPGVSSGPQVQSENVTDRVDCGGPADRASSQPPTSSALYSLGVRRLTADQPGAIELLSQAVANGPGVATAHVALACAYALDGKAEQAAISSESARRHLVGAPRRTRQHVEILSALIGGQIEHALGLAFEHIAEFGGDPLLLHVLSRWIGERQDLRMASELRALLNQTGPGVDYPD